MADQTKDQKVERSQLVRAYEASCKVDYPTPEELNFRRSLMIKLGLMFGLRGLRDKYELTSPGGGKGQAKVS